MPLESDTVSIIITILNGAKWIQNCFEAIACQTAVLQMQQHQQQHQQQQHAQNKMKINQKLTSSIVAIEVCVFDDSSSDETPQLLEKWHENFQKLRIPLRIFNNGNLNDGDNEPRGVGFGRNMAVSISTGSYLCFQDIDDEMLPNRVQKQYALAKRHQDAIIGSKFIRIPPNSTCRFTRWASNLEPQKLMLQIYTSNGPTVIMPTWMCHRQVYDSIPNGFCEGGKGTPEDLIFFYKHLDRGGRILRVDECLLKYNYHSEATTFSIASETIWQIRLKHLIEHVLCKEPWNAGFTIWNAGKQGRKFFRDLPLEEKRKVIAFCDVDKNKIYKYYQYYDELKKKITFTVPIIHFTVAQPPLLICMKLDLTNGAFETNLESLNLTEGEDYILFT